MFCFLTRIMHHILIGTDSRGNYFEDFLNQNNPFPDNWSVHIDVGPGRTVKRISQSILEKVKNLPVTSESNIVVMIAGGICNLTKKTNLTTGGYMLTYDVSNSQSMTTLQSEIKQAVHDFMDYNVVLKFATIPPDFPLQCCKFLFTQFF